MLSGLAVAAAVRQVAEVPATLKWPNDVIVEDRKLGGLLVERVERGGRSGRAGGRGDRDRAQRHDDRATSSRRRMATSLALESATTTDRATLVKAVLRRLEGLLAEWEAGGGVPSTRAAGRLPLGLLHRSVSPFGSS